MLHKSLLCLIFIVVVQSTTFYFMREAVCSNMGPGGCQAWNESSVVSKTGWTYYCFPSDTYLHTPQGPKAMAQLRIGDQVLGIDPKTGAETYSKIKEWLHHDPLAKADFQLITTNDSTSYVSSDLHNLGYFTADGKISYKFANEFKAGDSLVGFPHDSVQVTNITTGVNKQGLFSPFTENRNYFVYQKDFNSSSQKAPSMILAHSLSQVQNPQSKTTITAMAIWLTNLWMGASHQPQSHELYTHPSMSHMTWLYGGSWREAHNSVTYDLHQYYSGTYYSDNQRKRERERKLVSSIITLINIVSVGPQYG